MIKVKGLRELKTLTTDQPVYVSTQKRIYVNDNGEWIARSYFGVSEVALMVGIPQWQVRKMSHMLGLRLHQKKSIDHKSMLKMAKAAKIKKESPKRIKYESLKQNI